MASMDSTRGSVYVSHDSRIIYSRSVAFGDWDISPSSAPANGRAGMGASLGPMLSQILSESNEVLRSPLPFPPLLAPY